MLIQYQILKYLYQTNYNSYNVLKIRNPWGKIGDNLITNSVMGDQELNQFIRQEGDNQYIFNTKSIVE